jgi:transposase
LIELARLVKAGTRKTEIARLFGIHRVTVYRLIAKAKARGLL